MSQPSIRVVDVTDPLCHTPEFGSWLERHGVNPNQVTEVENINGEYLVVKGYAHDARGRKYISRTTREGATFEPFVIRLSSRMPCESTAVIQ